MTGENFISQNLPFGEAIPDTPHGVSVSIPILHDADRLFRYQDPRAWEQLQTTYPRFGVHPFVGQALNTQDQVAGRTTVAVSSPEAADRLIKSLQVGEIARAEVVVDGVMTFLSYTPGTEEADDNVRVALKRTGFVASSRRAEDFLVDKGILEGRFKENVYYKSDEQTIVEHLRRPYFPALPDVYIANSGMSAIDAALESTYRVRNQGLPQDEAPRDVWIRLGTLYRDSEDLVNSKQPITRTRAVNDVTDMVTLKELVEANRGRIVGVITEVPTNPLMAVPNLEQVRDIIGDVPLIVDVSSAGSTVVNALPYADIVAESLTKFASGHGDIMMGALAVNPDSQYRIALLEQLSQTVEPPYIRDVQRLAYELTSWNERTRRIGSNVVLLAEFFESHPRIKRVHWTGSERSRDAFAEIARDATINAGVITIEVKYSMRSTYDALNLCKGPSFGTKYTLNTPYVHITQPHAIKDAAARQMLQRRSQLNPRMLRVSVGTEKPDELINRYNDALAS